MENNEFEPFDEFISQLEDMEHEEGVYVQYDEGDEPYNEGDINEADEINDSLSAALELDEIYKGFMEIEEKKNESTRYEVRKKKTVTIADKIQNILVYIYEQTGIIVGDFDFDPRNERIDFDTVRQITKKQKMSLIRMFEDNDLSLIYIGRYSFIMKIQEVYSWDGCSVDELIQKKYERKSLRRSTQDYDFDMLRAVIPVAIVIVVSVIAVFNFIKYLG